MSRRRRRDQTPDSHLFPTKPYDLVKEFVVALVVMGLLTVALAAILSSPDRKALTLQNWAKAAPDDVVATATSELAGTSTSAGYGPPYNHAAVGQEIFGLQTQKWLGVTTPVDPANDFVINPLRTVQNDPKLTAALKTWDQASADKQSTWANAYADAIAAAPDNAIAKVKSGDYGPVPQLGGSFLTLAASGGLEGLLTSKDTFYVSNETKPLLLLADGAYLEDQARAEHLGGDQWGMMNETASYPGQPWLWLYTFWYQIKPFSTSGNADALVWGVMAVLSAAFVLLPFIPGLRSLPKHLRVHKLIWRHV